MKKYSFLEGFFATLFLILGMLVLICPIIISVLTKNWWFMSLFAITWIYSLILMMIAGAILE